MNRKDYCTISQATEILGVSPSTVWRWIEAGLLPAYRFGRRQILIDQKDLDTVLQPARPIAQVRVQRAMTERLQKIGGALVMMSASAPSNQKTVVKELRAFQARVLAERGGKHLPGSSTDLIRAARTGQRRR